jgi:putative tricarboxylic transport membrane protein
MVIGLVLGPLIEKHMREGLFMSLGDVSVFYRSPIAAAIWIVLFVAITGNSLRSLFVWLFAGRSR